MLTYKEIENLKPKSQTYNKGCGCGNGLILEVSSIKKGGSKCFVGRTRFRSRQVPVYVCSYGKGHGRTTSVKDANSKWIKILDWSRESGKNPADYSKKSIYESKTLLDAVNVYLKKKRSELSESTYTEYSRKLHNTILTKIDPATPLKELEWTTDGNGRAEVMRVIQEITDAGRGNNFDQAERCQDLLRYVFDEATRIGLMNPELKNPAARMDGDPKATGQNHHPAVHTGGLPQLLKDVSLNRINADPVSVLSTKFTLMTTLRTGALVRLQWDMIEKVDGIECFVIDGKTSGLKREKGKNDHIPHHVPITRHMKKIMKQIKDYSDGEKYLFMPIRQSRFEHLDPSTPNNNLRNLGYQGKQVAHGVRTLAETIGQDELGYMSEIIQRQLGHLVGDKTRRAYDRSLQLKKRKEFLDDWCTYLIDNGLRI